MSLRDFEKIMKNRPNLVILGAGASMAAIPNGDLYGKKTSVMSGFIEKLDMKELLDGIVLDTKSDNLEDIYSELFINSEYDQIRLELENRIHTYFSDFRIPNEPTIYDYLILSLRGKDAIATFNWDPLLVQAMIRVSHITSDLPELIFLHGNVAVGYCGEHKRGGIANSYCPVCKKKFENVPLLYPVKEKNYENNKFIYSNWNDVKKYMENAYLVTIFGYSAPKTDKSAIGLLSNAWGTPDDRNLEEFEIIDINDEEFLRNSWDKFIHTHHYSIHRSFFDSTIGKFPRRSVEATFDRLMNCRFLDGSKGLKPNMSFADLEEFFNPIIEMEKNNNYDVL